MNHPLSYSSNSSTLQAYRYAFNGKEKDNEIVEGDLDYGARIYDSRLGRWMTMDPMFNSYPSNSPYNFCSGNPIYYSDRDGQVQVDPKGNIIYQVVEGSKPVTRTYGSYSYTIEDVYVFSNDGDRIQTQRYTVVNTKTGQTVKNEVVTSSYNCHGHSVLKDKFRVNSSKAESNALLLDAGGFDQNANLQDKVSKDMTKMKDGDVVVLFNANGVAVHSYIYHSPNNVSSKNGELGVNEFSKDDGTTEVKDNATVQDVFDEYSKTDDANNKAVSQGYFTPVNNQVIQTGFAPKGTYDAPKDGTVEKNGGNVTAPVDNAK